MEGHCKLLYFSGMFFDLEVQEISFQPSLIHRHAKKTHSKVSKLSYRGCLDEGIPHDEWIISLYSVSALDLSKGGQAYMNVSEGFLVSLPVLKHSFRAQVAKKCFRNLFLFSQLYFFMCFHLIC